MVRNRAKRTKSRGPFNPSPTVQNYLPWYSEVLPAFGRDYKSAKDAKADFLAGKDWQLASLFAGGRYCSVRDFSAGTPVLLRYANAAKVCAVKVPSL